MAKFNRDLRTFETRVSFIRDIFSNKYEPIEIMAHCIQYKLGKSYEIYFKDILTSIWNLNGRDPMKILKSIDS
jgi:DNA-binding ferritin-like protein (Dps family)